MLISQFSIVADFSSISIIKSSGFKKSLSTSILILRSSIKWISFVIQAKTVDSSFAISGKYIDMWMNSINSCVVDSISLTFNAIYILLIETSNNMLRIHALSARIVSHSVFRHINMIFIIEISFTNVCRKFQLRNSKLLSWSHVEAIDVIILTFLLACSFFENRKAFVHVVFLMCLCRRFLDEKFSSQRLHDDCIFTNSTNVFFSFLIFCSS